MEKAAPYLLDQRITGEGGKFLRVTVVIPALNEAMSLPLVLRDLPPVQRVIVVNNGSTDATAAVALAGAMPLQSVFGNRLACFLMRWLFRASYTDLGPFRAIDYQALCSLGMSDRNFGWTIEMQIKAVQAGVRTVEIPVPYRPRVGQSKISGTFWGSVKAGGKILYTIAKYGLKPGRRAPPKPRVEAVQ